MFSKKMTDITVVSISTTSITLLRLIIIAFSVSSSTSVSVDLVSSVTTEQNDDYHRGNVNNRRGSNVHDLISYNDRLLSFHRMTKPITKNNVTEQQKDNDPFRLLDNLLIQNENNHDFISFQRMTQTVVGCIRTQNQLEIAITNAPNNSLVPTTINLCKELIFMDASTTNNITGERGIRVVNKYINFRCIINRNKKCIIDARSKSRHLVIINSTLIFNRMTFRNGNETKVNNTLAWGGSLLINSANIVINDCDFISNILKDDVDYAYGGAVGCSDCNMKLVNVNMINNSALTAGGTFYSTGSNVQMSNVSFLNNSAFFGGAVFSTEGLLEMINVSFINNNAAIEGGFSSHYNNMTLSNATMSNNKVYGYGGAIDINAGYADIRNSILDSNSAESAGGAIFSQSGKTSLYNVVLTNNSAINGTLTLGIGFDDNVILKSTLFSNSHEHVHECDLFFTSFWFEVKQESRLNLRPSPPPPRMQQQKQAKQDSIVANFIQSSPDQLSREECVTTYSALRNQVHLCNNPFNLAPCVVNICQARIEMTSMVNTSRPLNLSNKNIVINCQLNNDQRCVIDGQGLSRIFYGSNVAVTFHKIIFSNGYATISGGAIDLRKSFINLFNCSFVNNSAATGAAIRIKKTTFSMTGTESSFINNTGNSPSLVGYSSDLNLYDTLFEGNKMTKFGNGILLVGSTISLYNTTFSQTKKTADYDCNVFVAIDPKNLAKGRTCLDVSSGADYR